MFHSPSWFSTMVRDQWMWIGCGLLGWKTDTVTETHGFSVKAVAVLNCEGSIFALCSAHRSPRTYWKLCLFLNLTKTSSILCTLSLSSIEDKHSGVKVQNDHKKKVCFFGCFSFFFPFIWGRWYRLSTHGLVYLSIMDVEDCIIHGGQDTAQNWSLLHMLSNQQES